MQAIDNSFTKSFSCVNPLLADIATNHLRPTVFTMQEKNLRKMVTILINNNSERFSNNGLCQRLSLTKINLRNIFMSHVAEHE